ncbi:hypothetical protein [Rickettsiella massiliensis]|uniref:hypothetical protein n=1 Tax=Rickettsiella massiliensis TaxID=676517 RepID=UPI00030FCECD|nr:hypothetical protein [Rickettsiella massiliensis]
MQRRVYVNYRVEIHTDFSIPCHKVQPIPWGNVIGVDTLLGWGTGIEQSKIIYGQIPPQ